MKVCPFCDGELRDDAIKCWHCTMALPPVKVAKQNILEQKVPPREVSKITEEPPPRPSSQQSAVSTPHIEETKVKTEILSRPSSQQSAVSTPHIEETKVKTEILSRPPSQQSAVSTPRIEETKVKTEILSRPSRQQSAVSTPHMEEKKVKAETLSSPSPQQRAVGKPHIEENKLKAKTLFKAVIISISIIIVLAGILFTIANLNKREELVSVATPKVEAPVAQPAPAPAPVPDQPTGPTSNEDLERIAKEKHFNTIRNAHPDFDNLRDSGRIVAWIQKQPSRLRDSLLKTYNEGDADSVIALLNQFKKDKNSTRLPKDKVKVPKKDISVTNRPVDSEQHYQAIEGLKGIELQNGNVIEGQIISFKGDTVKIRTKDGKISTYSFMKEVKMFIY
jgi:hypothetical protein